MPTPRSVLSREAQLLLLTAGGPSNDVPLRRLLASELDWRTLGALARAEQAALIVCVLQTCSWSASTQWPAERYTGHQHLPPLVDVQAESLRLELHTHLFPSEHPFRLSADALWPGAKTVRLDQHTARVPDSLQQLV